MNIRNGSCRVLAGALASASALTLFHATFLVAQSSTPVSTQTDFGLNTTTFQTPQGQIQVNLPGDASAGDSLSGSVYAIPSGSTDQQRASNQDQLNGDVVQIQNQKTQVAKKLLEFGAPAAAGATALVLLDGSGKQVASSQIEIKPAQPPAAPSESFQLPTISQAGRPLEIPGPFDGNSTTTQVSIGGKATEVLAESPRETTVQAPSDALGPQPIHVQKGTAVADGMVRNLAIKLSAPNTRLKEGQTTTLTVTVSGLEELTTNVPLRLVDHSDAIVSLEGGDSQTITIHPSDVQAGGVFTVTRTLTGIEVGDFNLVAIVTEPISESGAGHGPVIEASSPLVDCPKCSADNLDGPTGLGYGNMCVAAANCKNNDPTLTSQIANKWCHENQKSGGTGKGCGGDCPGTDQCEGNYDPDNSHGVTLNARVVKGDPMGCNAKKAGDVTCSSIIEVAQGGQLACKCKCEPLKF